MLKQARMEGKLGQVFPVMPVPSAAEPGKDSSDTSFVAQDLEPTCMQSVQHAATGQVTSIPPTSQTSSCLEDNEDVDVDRMEE